MPWKNGCSAAFACSVVTPGFSRPNTLTQRLRRLSMSSQFGVICAFIITGTRTLGDVADVDAVEAGLRDADDRERVVVDR